MDRKPQSQKKFSITSRNTTETVVSLEAQQSAKFSKKNNITPRTDLEAFLDSINLTAHPGARSRLPRKNPVPYKCCQQNERTNTTKTRFVPKIQIQTLMLCTFEFRDLGDSRLRKATMKEGARSWQINQLAIPL